MSVSIGFVLFVCFRAASHGDDDGVIKNDKMLQWPKQLKILQGPLFRGKNGKMKIGRIGNVIQSQTVS